jgi:phage terminase large subunit-like protein
LFGSTWCGQQAFVRDVNERKQRGDHRIVRCAVLSVGRKNGKSALTAALFLAHLGGPEAMRNGEIYSAAMEREQTAIVFKIVAQMVRADPELLAKSTLTCRQAVAAIAFCSAPNGSGCQP